MTVFLFVFACIVRHQAWNMECACNMLHYISLLFNSDQTYPLTACVSIDTPDLR